MNLEQRALQLRESKEKQDEVDELIEERQEEISKLEISKLIGEKQEEVDRLDREWDDVEFVDSDKEIKDYLFGHGFRKVEVKGVNPVYYNLEGYVFWFDKKCEGCCYYDAASRYKFSKVKDPNDPQKVKAAINEANQYRVKYTVMAKVLLYGLAAAAGVGFAVYNILDNFTSLQDIGPVIGVSSGMFAYMSFVAAGIADTEAKEKKAKRETGEAREIIANTTNDSIVKLVETFSQGYDAQGGG